MKLVHQLACSLSGVEVKAEMTKTVPGSEDGKDTTHISSTTQKGTEHTL